MNERPERAVDGESLFETSRQIKIAFGDIWNPSHTPTWDEITWRERDAWQAQADEINESRRGTP